ncbi:MAG: hypothetical protein GF334_12675 [Candidatus Altiarchaeales archaeon]|nr:hypothetical protein [Candidatus Altiarchaeales archaeon]
MDYWTETGLCAGKIYRAVEKLKKPPTVAALKKKIKDKNFDYAIGWLLRENKVKLEKKRNSVYVFLG